MLDSVEHLKQAVKRRRAGRDHIKAITFQATAIGYVLGAAAGLGLLLAQSISKLDESARSAVFRRLGLEPRLAVAVDRTQPDKVDAEEGHRSGCDGRHTKSRIISLDYPCHC